MSSSEIIIIALVILILFGGKKLPELLRAWVRIVQSYKRSLAQFKRQAGLDMLGRTMDLRDPLKDVEVDEHVRGRTETGKDSRQDSTKQNEEKTGK